MTVPVFVPGAVVFEPLEAATALQRPLARVDPPVRGEVGEALGLVVALVAGVGPLPRVRPLVSVLSLPRGELLLAVAARILLQVLRVARVALVLVTIADGFPGECLAAV